MSVIDPSIAALQTAVETLQNSVSALLDKQKWLILYKNKTVDQLTQQSGIIDSLHQQMSGVQNVLTAPMELMQENDKLVIKPQK